uniref:Uncharacterized protein n=1 Tax=viral metagenome TaxID=1070528 RepID=A0A6M3KXG7_9ZZZZ
MSRLRFTELAAAPTAPSGSKGEVWLKDDQTVHLEDKNSVDHEFAFVGPTHMGAAESITIAVGVAAATGLSGNLVIDTAGGASSDALDKITGFATGDVVVVRAANDARSVVVTNGSFMRIGSDFTLNNAYDNIVLLNIGSDVFIQTGRNNNGA